MPNFRRHLSSADFFFFFFLFVCLFSFFFFLHKLSLGKKFIFTCKVERLNVKMSNSIDPDASSGSMLFAKVYYYRVWQ